jgi:hypothetical protein
MPKKRSFDTFMYCLLALFEAIPVTQGLDGHHHISSHYPASNSPLMLSRFLPNYVLDFIFVQQAREATVSVLHHWRAAPKNNPLDLWPQHNCLCSPCTTQLSQYVTDVIVDASLAHHPSSILAQQQLHGRSVGPNLIWRKASNEKV